MAKARKSEKTESTAPAVGGAKKKAPVKSTKPANPPGTPLIDTSLAAQAAARMISAKAAGAPPAPEAGDMEESSLFKQMKENVAKPHASSVESLLNNTNASASQRSSVPFGSGGKQVGHNQTFGADVSRRNLPRRTGG